MQRSKSKDSSAGGRVVRKRLASGEIKEYHYPAYKPQKSRIQPGTLDELLSAFRMSPKYAALGAGTRVCYDIYLRELDAIGSLRVEDVTRKRIIILRDAIARSRGNGAATNFGRIASAVFAWAVDAGWIPFSPLARLKAPPGGHLPTWTESDLATALAAMPEPLRRALVLAVHTGQRRGDLIRLRWSSYDPARRTISLRQRKTGAALVLPCPPALAAELDAWRAETRTLTILATPTGLPWTESALTHALCARLARIGMAGKNIHGLRKLAAVRLAHAGCTPHEIAAITGHASLAMVQLYTRGVDQARLAVVAVDRLSTAEKP